MFSFEVTDGTDGDTALEAKHPLLLGGMRGAGRELKGIRRRGRREIRGEEGGIIGL